MKGLYYNQWCLITGNLTVLGDEKQVVMATGQKRFKNFFRLNLPRQIFGEVTFDELVITNVKVIKKTIIHSYSSPPV